jgi:hypothetical protein
MRRNAYAINLGRGMVDSVGFPLIDTRQEIQIRNATSGTTNELTRLIRVRRTVEYMPSKPGTDFPNLLTTVVWVREQRFCDHRSWLRVDGSLILICRPMMMGVEKKAWGCAAGGIATLDIMTELCEDVELKVRAYVVVRR